MKILSVLLLLSGSLFAQDSKPPLQSVATIDLGLYIGSWYEIAAIPQRFQKDCVRSKAEYKASRLDRVVWVKNTCLLKNGKSRSARALAWVPNKDKPSQLKVTFFPPFAGDYWVIELADDYSYAVVGDPSREYLWILAREAQMADDLYNDLLEKIKETHLYDISKIVKTSENEIN